MALGFRVYGLWLNSSEFGVWSLVFGVHVLCLLLKGLLRFRIAKIQICIATNGIAWQFFC